MAKKERMLKTEKEAAHSNEKVASEIARIREDLEKGRVARVEVERLSDKANKTATDDHRDHRVFRLC